MIHVWDIEWCMFNDNGNPIPVPYSLTETAVDCDPDYDSVSEALQNLVENQFHPVDFAWEEIK